MTEQEQDALVRQCLLDALRADWAEVLAQAPEAVPSPRQRRRMNAMLADPVGYARRRSRFGWRRVLHTAACAALVCLVSLGTLLAVSPTIRAEFPNWVREITHFYFSYQADGLPADHSGDVYTIADLPEGYALARDYPPTEKRHEHTWLYRNGAGEQDVIELACVWEGSREIERDYYDEEPAEVHGNDALFYRFAGFHPHRNLPGYELFYDQEDDAWMEELDPWGNILVWTDPNTGMLFTLYAYFNKDDMVRMAESVTLVTE